VPAEPAVETTPVPAVGLEPPVVEVLPEVLPELVPEVLPEVAPDVPLPPEPALFRSSRPGPLAPQATASAHDAAKREIWVEVAFMT
jgi:N-acyl-L-homoserine lactone synthetase